MLRGADKCSYRLFSFSAERKAKGEAGQSSRPWLPQCLLSATFARSESRNRASESAIKIELSFDLFRFIPLLLFFLLLGDGRTRWAARRFRALLFCFFADCGMFAVKVDHCLYRVF